MNHGTNESSEQKQNNTNNYGIK